ncbi:patatin-like phospholipase family protein [Lapillicoccus sp.]|uniref:patatin-like phospholipase family protein n=1 Tax=Lapillicoccus sp. TaxID=1909287 RepID=UPI003983CAD7
MERNLGAAQAGTLAALGKAGIRPDLIGGTSAGAVNGALRRLRSSRARARQGPHRSARRTPGTPGTSET